MEREELIEQPSCGADCPFVAKGGFSFCCSNCSIKPFVLDTLRDCKNGDRATYKKAWTNKFGFASENGCKLPRRFMPTECLEYDCKGKVFLTVTAWVDGKWKHPIEINMSQNDYLTEKQFQLKAIFDGSNG